MSFPSYPRYQDSGSEWLGHVPAHWEVTKLSYISSRIGSGKTPTGGAETYVPSGVVFIRSQNVHDDGLRLDDVVFISESMDKEMAWSRVKPLDVLLNITGASIGRTCLVPAGFLPANVNQHVCVIRLEQPESHAKWVSLAMTSAATKSQVDINQTGAAREGLNFEQVSDFLICVPPCEERRQIARFLNHETAKIDALIREQERLIELLQEKRQAVISHAVTKGLDPDVPMKDSGVEWLGEVPAHWEIRKLSTITDKITNGYVGPTRGLFTDEGVRYLQSLHIKNNEIRFNQPYFVPVEWSNDHSKSILKEGDVLIVQTGDIGQSAVVTREFAGSNCHALIVVSAIQPILDGNYLSWVLNSPYGKNTLLSIQTGALHPHLNCGYVKDVWIPLPPIDEQRRIVDQLQSELTSFQSLTEQASAMAGILRERRSALISAAVTGKIDVRDWQPPADESAFDEEVRHAGLETTA
ncbi:restriction endonuclease subunit S [Marinobacter sp.]|uniref:restriction endonuclease subunit S n=1 Tax=Marinobacter sp. TaxID=50741 RepID=UPI00384D3B4A